MSDAEPTISDVLARLDGLQADIQLQFATVHADLARLRRASYTTGDELRQRIITAEATTINEFRSLGERLDGFDERITRLESK